MKSLNLTLSLAQCGWGGEGLARRLTFYFTGQTIVGTMARFARVMAVAARLSTASADRGDRSAAEIAQFENLAQNDGPLLFQIGKSLRHDALHS